MKRAWIWVLIGGVLLGVAGVYAIGSRSQPPAEIRIPKPSQVTTERLKLEQVASSGLAGSLELKKAEKTPQGWVVQLRTDANHANLGSLLEQAKAVFAEVKRTKIPVAALELDIRTDELRDEFGRQLTNEPIARLGLTGETFAKIVWDEFDPRDFARVADDYWLHVRLRPQHDTMLEGKKKDEEHGAISVRKPGP
ncbi:MAG: hypothetical protein ACOX4G_03525 [Limnochordia bacterium]